MGVFTFEDRYGLPRRYGKGQEYGTILLALDAMLADSPPVPIGNLEFAGHDMTGVPAVPDLDRKVLARVEQHGLCPDDWHRGPQHCRGGYAIDLAGPEGHRLEQRYGPKVAASLIYAASCPGGPVPSFYLDVPAAMADLRGRIAS